MDGSLLTSTHVNGEGPLTWQTMHDVENDANARRNGMAAFRRWIKARAEQAAEEVK